jgi:hypothetical protein
LAAVIKHWPTNLSRAAAVLLIPFAAPGATAMEYFTQDLNPGHPWFDALVVRYDTPCLLLLGFLLAWCISRPSQSARHALGGS